MIFRFYGAVSLYMIVMVTLWWAGYHNPSGVFAPVFTSMYDVMASFTAEIVKITAIVGGIVLCGWLAFSWWIDTRT